MSNADDMDKPVTHGQMRDMFANFLDAIMARIDERFVLAESRLTQELRGQVNAIRREHLDELTKFEDKYKDLPERVAKLEAVAFASKRRRSR